MLKENIDISNDFAPQTLSSWKEKVISDLKGKTFESLQTETYEGITLDPIYDFESLKNKLSKIPYPTQVNYRRGFQSSGFTYNDWQIAQNTYETTPKEFNKKALHDLEHGQNSISVSVNSPTVDIFSDRFSLRINNYNDFKIAFSGIDLTNIPLHISVISDFQRFPDYLNKFVLENRLLSDKLKCSVSADPIRLFVTTGKLPAKKLNNDSLMFTRFVQETEEAFPTVKSIGVDSSIYSEAGGSAVQELAFALASAVEYLNFLNEDLPTTTLVNKMKFTFSVGTNFFMEIAKLRAFRILWSSVLEGFGISQDEAPSISLAVKSLGFLQTFTEPYSNMLRATTEAFSAVIGGADIIETAPFNIGFEKPDEFARRIARNIQIIIREETGIRFVIDSAAGSYYVENLTDKFVVKSWELFQTIEKEGGMISALEKGIPQKLINDVRKKKITDLKKRKFKLIGTNVYVKSADNIPYEIKTNPINNITDNWKEIDKLDFTRASQIFEDLLKRVFNYSQEVGEFPSVEAFTLGAVPQYKPRYDFSRALFETAAFKLNVTNINDDDWNEVADKISTSQSSIILFASSDSEYEKSIDAIKKIASDFPRKTIIVAGKNKEIVNELKEFNNVEFIFAGMDVYDFLNQLFENKILNVKNV